MGLFGSGGNAAKEAEKQEAAREASISSTQGNINRIFDSPDREGQRQSFLQALRARLVDSVQEQHADAQRRSKFALARGGLTGGSAAVDQGTRLAKLFQRGLVGAESKAQGGYSDLLAADEEARSGLLGQAQAGLSTGAAAQQASAGLRASIGKARSRIGAETVNDVFGGLGDTWKTMEEASERRRGAAVPLYG